MLNDYGSSYYAPFEYLGLQYSDDKTLIFKNPERIALVVFTGGEDVSPKLYGCSAHYTTHANIGRDAEELRVAEQAMLLGIPMAGICRGSQFLCVMAGGRLVQDVSGHLGEHDLVAINPDGSQERITVTSTHHQMQFPFDMQPDEDYTVLAWTPTPRSSHYAMDRSTVVTAALASEQLRSEPDIIWYPKIKALAMQFHPEWMHDRAPAIKYLRRVINHRLVPIMREQGVVVGGPREAAVEAAG